jgi:cytoskeletal protein CcmA (bactofilin family)
MSLTTLSTFLNVKDSHLRVVSGNVYAQAMNIGGINIDTTHGLDAVTATGNVAYTTLQFADSTTAFITTSNAEIGRNLNVTGNILASGDLNVTGNVDILSDTSIFGNTDISSDLSVTGDVDISSNLSVSGNVTLESVITNQELTVNGNAYVASDLVVNGNVTVFKEITINKDVTTSGNVSITNYIKYDSAWFYAYNGTSGGSGYFNDYSGFVPWSSVSSGSSHFTTGTTTSGGYYTTPIDGIYHLDTSVLNYPDTRTGISEIFFSVNGNVNGVTNGFGYNRKNNMPEEESLTSSTTIKLNKGDIIKVYVTNIDCYTTGNSVFFSGYLVTRI